MTHHVDGILREQTEGCFRGRELFVLLVKLLMMSRTKLCRWVTSRQVTVRVVGVVRVTRMS